MARLDLTISFYSFERDLPKASIKTKLPVSNNKSNNSSKLYVGEDVLIRSTRVKLPSHNLRNFFIVYLLFKIVDVAKYSLWEAEIVDGLGQAPDVVVEAVDV